MADINVSSPTAGETTSIRSAFQAILGNWRILAASGVAVPITGSTGETALATITVPAGSMGANGIIRVNSLWSATNNGNNKTIRVRWGGGSGTQYLAQNLTTQIGWHHLAIITNRNSQSSQIGNAGNVYGSLGGAPATAAVDTSASTTVVLSAQLANSADTATLEAYYVEVFYQA